MSQSARRCLLCLAKGWAIIHTNGHTENTELGWKHPLSSVTRGTLFAMLLLAAVTSPNPAGKRLHVYNKQVSNVFTSFLYSVFTSFSMLYTGFYLYTLLRPHFYVIGPVTAFSSPHQGLSPSSPYFLSVSISPISENYYSAKWTHQLSRVLLIKAVCDRQ